MNNQPPLPTHLHAEQFDGHLHAACNRLGGLEAPSPRIVGEDDFDKLTKWQRCRYCARINWPRGGEPE
jgi:hypothetical protein